MQSLPKILLLYAHPESQNSVANKVLLKQVQHLEHVTIHDLYAQYPDFFIDVRREQQLLCEHQLIVFQHPLYTYSCPALLKEWFDRVLVRGFANGIGGHALKGKYWRSVITAGEAEGAYRTKGYKGYAMEDILRPFELTAVMCHMHWMAPMIIYRVRRQRQETLASHAMAYSEWLQSPLKGET